MTTFPTVHARKKFQKCPLHASKVSIAINKLVSQEPCKFLSILGTVQDNDVLKLADALKKNTGVESFFFGPKSKISNYGMTVVMEAIAENKHMITFGLWSEEANDHALTAVGNMLKTNAMITSISVDYAYKVTGVGVQAFGKALHHNHALRTLSLKVGKTNDASMVPLFTALGKKENVIRMLTFATYSEEEDERFGDKAAVVLAQSLKKNKELLILSLSHTNVGDVGATGIFQALSKHPELNHLTLRNCTIGDPGAMMAGQYIASNPKLGELILDHNNFGNHGAAFIGEALVNNTHLNTLSLVNAPMSDVGASAILQGLAGNDYLTDVVLRRTGQNVREFWREKKLPKISDATMKGIKAMIERNKQSAITRKQANLDAESKAQSNPGAGDSSSKVENTDL